MLFWPPHCLVYVSTVSLCYCDALVWDSISLRNILILCLFTHVSVRLNFNILDWFSDSVIQWLAGGTIDQSEHYTGCCTSTGKKWLINSVERMLMLLTTELLVQTDQCKHIIELENLSERWTHTFLRRKFLLSLQICFEYLLFVKVLCFVYVFIISNPITDFL